MSRRSIVGSPRRRLRRSMSIPIDRSPQNDTPVFSLALTKCIIDRDFAISRSVHKRAHKLNDTYYIPRCDENGLFEQQQIHQNGSSWCVDVLNGKRMKNTFVKEANKPADCSKGISC